MRMDVRGPCECSDCECEDLAEVDLARGLLCGCCAAHCPDKHGEDVADEARKVWYANARPPTDEERAYWRAMLKE